MAPPLSQSEIQEITRLLEQGKALPEKYRDILFVDQTQSEPQTATPEHPVQPLHLRQSADGWTGWTMPMTAFVKYLLDDPRVEELIREYESRVVPSTRRHQLVDLSTGCVKAIGIMLPQIQQKPSGIGGLLSRWATRAVLPAESAKELSSIIHQRFKAREAQVVREERAREIAEETEGAERLLTKYSEVVNAFFEIAERRVSVLDEYGDERMHLLDKEVNDCFAKIAGREGANEIEVKKELRKFDAVYSLPKAFARLRLILRDRFLKHHAEQRDRKKTIDEMASLSGVDFETAVGRILSEKGWHVSATAATGDQGADIIASKGDRKVIIQAKRYNGAVGNKAVQEVVGAIPFYGGTEGCVVTNSTFTPSARALAQKNNIRLIDGFRFEEIANL